MKWIALAALALALPACSVYREATSPKLDPAVSWRRVVTDNDRERLRKWRKAWDEALVPARAAPADAAAIDADPTLFAPDQALGGAALPPGDYRCRTFKLGGVGAATPGFTAYSWFDCVIVAEGDALAFHKLTGSQRPAGLIFPENDARQIFVGTLVLGDETSPLRYGTDRDRDMVGYVERIGDKRWRLVLPYPRFESLLDVIELVPKN